MFERILVAVDGSEGSKKAVSLAGELAKGSGGEVLAFHVREVEVGHFSGAMEAPVEATELVNATVKELASEGVNAKGEARGAPFGRAAAEIVDRARSYGADVIVMGTRGLSDVTAMLVGSVAHKVLHMSHCPVLVAR